MAVVNATFPTTRKTTKKARASKKVSKAPFDENKNRMDLAKAKASVAMFYLMK